MVLGLATAWQLEDFPRRAQTERPIAELFSEADYPPGALRQGVEGSTQIEVDIGTSGRPTRCIVTYTSGNSELDSRTCAVTMERARFRAALDHAGRPVPDTASFKIIWRIRDLPHSMFRRERVVSILTPGAEGPTCTIQVNTEPMVQIGARECLDRFGPDIAAEVPPGWQGIIVETFVPQGNEPSADQAVLDGALQGRAVFELTFKNDGSLDSCRVLESQPHARYARSCEFLEEFRVEPVPGSQARRVARWTTTYHLKPQRGE